MKLRFDPKYIGERFIVWRWLIAVPVMLLIASLALPSTLLRGFLEKSEEITSQVNDTILKLLDYPIGAISRWAERPKKPRNL